MSVILHIEDDDFIARIVKTVVEREGHTSYRASNAHEGILLARQVRPELILMDFWLPDEVDGMEATEMIKRDEDLRDVIVVALTAQNSKHAKDRALEAGCTAYIEKPFEMRELSECLRKLLA